MAEAVPFEVYDWAKDDGALAPGTDHDVALRFLAIGLAFRVIEVAEQMNDFIATRGLADEYRAWLAAR